MMIITTYAHGDGDYLDNGQDDDFGDTLDNGQDDVVAKYSNRGYIGMYTLNTLNNPSCTVL